MTKIQYSKILPVLTIIIFCVCLVVGFLTDFTSVEDTSFFVTAITVSGTACLTTNVWYMKNSQAEKVARIKAESYRIISEERIKYNRSMLELQKEFNIDKDDIDELENDSPMDELMDGAENDYSSSIDGAMDEATSSVEVESV